ncbi:hypothetical protein B9479_008268, partial [Cryptococcus floricola]
MLGGQYVTVVQPPLLPSLLPALVLSVFGKAVFGKDGVDEVVEESDGHRCLACWGVYLKGRGA